MKRTITFVLLTFVLTGLATYLFMSQIVMPREIAKATDQALNQKPLLTSYEVRGLVRVHCLGNERLFGIVLNLKNWTQRYEKGKWVVSGSAS